MTTDSPHSGTYHLKFDQAGTNASNLQQATLLMDLSGQASATDLEMDFWMWRWDRDQQTNDVWIDVSGDGSTWQTLVGPLSPWQHPYTHYAFDLDQLLQANGVAPDADVYFRFVHSGLTSTCEMALDDLRISNVDAFGPRVVSQTPSGTVAGPLDAITVTFDELIDAATFQPSDVTLTDPFGNAVPIDSVTDTGDHLTFRILPRGSIGLSGTYTLAVGPDVCDLAGNVMNQNGDAVQGDGYSGTFGISQSPPRSLPYSQDFESGSLAALAGWTFARTYGTIRVSNASPHLGAYVLELSDSSNRGSSDYQDAILHLDLAGRTDVCLDFWTKEFSGTQSSANVSISADGATWTALASIPDAPTYQHFVVSLDAAGVAYSTDTQIRFRRNAQYSGGFAWDDVHVTSKAPAVVLHTPADEVPPGQSHFTLEFDEPMNTASFAVADDVVSFTGPGGDLNSQITGFNWVNSYTLQVNFNQQTAFGTYHMAIGPNILDLAGKPMDQDADGINGENPDDLYHACFTISDQRGYLQFDGGDRVIIPSSASLNPPQVTVESWVNFARLAYGTGNTTNVQYILSKGGDRTSGAYRLWQGGSGPGQYSIGFAIGEYWRGWSITSAAALVTGHWYHLAATYDGQAIKLYLDGTLIGSSNVGPLTVGNTAPLYMSFNDVSGWPYYLTGAMDDVRVWNYARSQDENPGRNERTAHRQRTGPRRVLAAR